MLASTITVSARLEILLRRAVRRSLPLDRASSFWAAIAGFVMLIVKARQPGLHLPPPGDVLAMLHRGGDGHL
ncbi:MAG: hypothetical protein U1F37_14615 [Alphaproteobacteria bacterium]